MSPSPEALPSPESAMCLPPRKGSRPAASLLAHPFPPVWDAASRVLILGSFPSVLSRANAFYYGNPRNRFWQVLEQVWEQTIPGDAPGRRQWLLDHRLALWDVMASVQIRGSSDTSIRQAAANDLSPLLSDSVIRRVFLNGQAAARVYRRQVLPRVPLPAVTLPSTSPANASWDLPRLTEAWRVLRLAVEEG